MFTFSIVFVVVAVLVFFASFVLPGEFRHRIRFGSGFLGALAALLFVGSMFVTVPTSHQGVLKQYGEVLNDKGTLTEGLHMILPWRNVVDVYTGISTAEAKNAESGTRDTQTVHANLVVNYQVSSTGVLPLYHLKPNLNYEAEIVIPQIYEVFKAVVAKHIAEELIVQREQVSTGVLNHLRERLAPFNITVASVAMTNFGFSKSFNDSIEEKVAASQRAQTAERNKETARFNAESRVLTAEGEAKAIAIQAAATEKSGGASYIQLQAIGKWDGKLPQYMAAGSPLPFISVGGK